MLLMSQQETPGHHGSPDESTELHWLSGLAKKKISKIKLKSNQSPRSN